MSYFYLFRQMWLYAAGDRRKLVFALILHALSQLGIVATPLLVARVLNSIQKYEQGQVLEKVTFWLLLWIGANLWYSIFHRAGRYYELHLSYRVRQRFISRHYEIITNLPYKWHTDHHSGDTIDRVSMAANEMQNFTNRQWVYLNYLMMFWGPVIGLTFISWKVSLLAFVVSSGAIAVIAYFDRRLIILYRTIRKISHMVAATFYDYVSNIRTIITLRLGRRTLREFERRIETGYAPFMEAEAWINGIKWFLIGLFSILTQAMAMFYYIWQRLGSGEGILIGNVAAVLQYVQRLTNSFSNIARVYQDLMEQRISVEAIEEITKAWDERVARTGAPLQNWERAEISGLTFRYGDKTALDGLTFSFARGEKVALVGESGSGKSTLMSILRGLYEPDDVRLSLDGAEHDSLRPLGEITTLIPQDPEIFENTIAYNVHVGVDYPEEEVEQAVHLACFAGVVERLPYGLETDVRERGVTLSGGEKQRLALARGILAARTSTIVLMDEPTSSVDTINEMQIHQNVFSHFRDATMIASVHRLNLLARFDTIIMMDHGRIVQKGTFEDLTQTDGPFRDLWLRYLESTKTE